jgi:hypothetical protein
MYILGSHSFYSLPLLEIGDGFIVAPFLLLLLLLFEESLFDESL